ncbi:MAG TPA: ion channel, partial [Gemmatimonadaceae bacterium]|nr:ion channel [Gemmatimonadaceae bacterium]
LFALAFMACGPNGMLPGSAPGITSHFAKAFFFSVNTLGTIGYGSSGPGNFAANVVVSAESLVGLLGFALATGILFARFSRPIGELIFSDTSVVAPYRTKTAFMFRVVNRRSNQLIELEATVLFSRLINGIRRYDKLVLERPGVVFFPLSWTIVHPIDESSPLWNVGPEELAATEAEILILITGTDETFAQSVHARSSYKASEIAFGYAFVGIYRPVTADGVASIDVRRLSEIEPAADAAPAG